MFNTPPQETNLLSPAERQLIEAAVRACCSHPPVADALSHNRVTSVPSAKVIESALCTAILGQNHVARAVVETLAVSAAGLALRPGRPAGVFLFTGPTGVGKTESAVTLAAVLTGRGNRLLRIDCSEYSESHQIARLIGAPPSYVGYGATSPVEEFLKDPIGGVLLFDEFEKADPALHRLCLQIFDAGCLTTSAGKVLDLSRLTVIATSNVRATSNHGPIGFHNADLGVSPNEVPLPPMAALSHVFAPELLNRFDCIVAFRPIGPETARHIMRDRLLPAVRERIRRLYAVNLEVDSTVEDLVVARGYSDRFGVRHLQRSLSSLVLAPVAEALSSLTTGCESLVVTSENDVVSVRATISSERSVCKRNSSA